MKRLSYALVILAAVSWGIIGIFTKQIAALGFTELEMLFIKVVIGVAVLVPIFLVKDRSLFCLHSIFDLKYFVGTGICSFVFFSWCYMKAINITSLGVAAVLLYTAPTIVMVFSLFLFHEKLTGKKVIVLAMTFLGCILVTGLLEAGAGRVTAKGILLGLCAGFGYALYSIFGTFALRKNYRSMTITFYTFLVAAVFMAFLVNPFSLVQRITEQKRWLFTITFAVSTTIVPYLAYTAGLSHIEASRASIIATIEPVVAAVVGILLFGESASAMKLAGIALVLSSVFFMKEKPAGKQEDIATPN